MSYVAWKGLWPLVLPQVPLAPTPMVTKAIRDATRELCERSFVWKDTFSLPVGGSKGDYTFPSSSNYRVARLDSAVYAGAELDILSAEETQERYPTWRSGEVTGPPSVVTQLDYESFWLVPFPNTNSYVTLSVSLKPKRTAPKVQDWLIEEHEETIAAGAIARLKAMTNVPWSSPAEAGGYANLFMSGVARINSEVAKGFGRAPIRVRPQFL